MIFRLPKRTQPGDKPDTQPDTQPNAPLPQLKTAAHRSGRWFWLSLALQTGLILAVPAQDAYTYATGRPVTLQTVPVDPYDPLRGYSQTLSYDISDAARLKQLPGGGSIAPASDFYLVLEAPAASSASQPPKPWKPVRVSLTRPNKLPANQVALQGKTDRSSSISYGLETYYMPEDQRGLINAEIGKIQQGQQAFVVDIKVDSSGNAVPISLWVKNQNYRF